MTDKPTLLEAALEAYGSAPIDTMALVQHIHSCHDECQVPICVVQRELATANAKIKALEDTLRAIQNVRVNKHADNIWTGADKCRAIADEALEQSTENCGK